MNQLMKYDCIIKIVWISPNTTIVSNNDNSKRFHYSNLINNEQVNRNTNKTAMHFIEIRNGFKQI